MTIKTIRIALAAAASLAAIGTAHAASHDLATFIREQDLDGDGKVSKDEFQRGRDAEFARMDRNHDGVLSHDEYVGDYRERLEKELLTEPAASREEERVRQLRQADVRFGVLDSDHSGGITSAEFAATGWGMFLHHDTNHDGWVSAEDAATKADPAP
ncbi:EF hand domain-containing protein [Novosphingobium sp. PhB165]|uniref:EF-hand domain-containing protein n=1 Tax=Novosphingobium sp. PhB165 TaxID=2485105 RepID=UPI0010471CC3|nr:EF-hand domain-containing protein [Novosphingobium sp. PhB165]TCM15681.1 EF hand domain-containing protein [Novosphingobium sp. PhB165]